MSLHKDLSILSSVELSKNALTVLEKRYLTRNEEGQIVETPEELFWRVAKHIASAELLYGKSPEDVEELAYRFYKLMTSFSFLPNSPTLMNAGKPLGQLSACFVIPVEDSMESIFDAVKAAAIIHKTGGGTGFSFSRLRPKGDVVGSTKGISSGPVSFMTVFDTATEAVKQGGTRRGANMGILRIDHPDILEFITCKDKEGRFSNFNISVAITEEFMKAVLEDREYELINPRTKKVVSKLRAREVFDRIVHHAWLNGEPGIIFIDRINQTNPTPHVGSIESTNPCGEQPLLPYESCNLGSINLAKFVKNDGKPEVDWQRLKETTWLSVHFLDNVIDVNKYPLPQIEQNTKANRKIGLGVMGWADMLIQLRIPYNSKRALELAEKVMGFIHKEARACSSMLAEERGVFPNYPGSIYDGKIRLRNATLTTIAPTGSLSIIAGCSPGIEPLFAVTFVRNVLDGTKLIEVNPYFEKEARERGFWSEKLMEAISVTGSIQNFSSIPEDIKRIYLTAHDITPEDHIRMQAAFQKYVDNAVSKTVNFPNSATVEDVRKVYLLAYELGCKGVTVYRDGSRESQVITKGGGKESKEKSSPKKAEESQKIIPRKRPELVKGATLRMETGCGNLYVTINADENGSLFEVFTHMGKAGGCAASQSEAIGRLVSLALRSNIAPEEIIKQLKGISCHQPAWHNGGRILSCSDAIAKAIEKYRALIQKDKGAEEKHRGMEALGTSELTILHASDYTDCIPFGSCPECGGAIEHEGGCAVCRSCGFTKCS
ncbi:MAG: vitamin B12-dependent ribonucleotide reductase [Thermodesulfovibrionales bacterium]|nr:vitamin B12-dependent ribonucleotide reductase [Thermodesulfovibrionales bacterium]